MRVLGRVYNYSSSAYSATFSLFLPTDPSGNTVFPFDYFNKLGATKTIRPVIYMVSYDSSLNVIHNPYNNAPFVAVIGKTITAGRLATTYEIGKRQFYMNGSTTPSYSGSYLNVAGSPAYFRLKLGFTKPTAPDGYGLTDLDIDSFSSSVFITDYLLNATTSGSEGIVTLGVDDMVYDDVGCVNVWSAMLGKD